MCKIVEGLNVTMISADDIFFQILLSIMRVNNKCIFLVSCKAKELSYYFLDFGAKFFKMLRFLLI